MSLRALPLIVISFILYNIVVLFSGSQHADDVLRKVLFELPMVGGARWRFSMGDLLILITMFLLFFELIKSTYTASSSLLDSSSATTASPAR